MFKTAKVAKQKGPSKGNIDHNVEAAPYVLMKSGKPQLALKVDSVRIEQDLLIVEGWRACATSSIDISALELWINGAKQEMAATPVLRDDVEASMRSSNPLLKSDGFLLQASLPASQLKQLQLSWKVEVDQDPICFDIQVPRGATNTVPAQAAVSGSRFEKATWQAADPLKVSAHVDRFGIMPQRSGLVAGWVVMQPGWELWLIDSDGNAESLDKAVRYQREDIVELFRAQYGQHTVNAGFVMQWPHALIPGAALRLVAYNPSAEVAFDVFHCTAEEVSSDPEGYARWAFTVPTPAEKFNDRLNQWEGELIEGLLADRQAYFDANGSEPEVLTLGEVPKSPTLSLIIPLYNRWDFVEHQLLAFSRDPSLLETTEIIYVVDDPRILTAISNEVENLHRLYNVPFKLVWGHRNRGFSGANNLGVSISRGRQVLLLNSDAFPTTPGWAQQLSGLLDENPGFGMLGARLLNPEGGMQHAGMVFFHSASWQVWLNKHPLAGLSPQLDLVPEGVDVIEKPAVTGACVIMTRALYDAVGGLDEGYLIGDFEDSDLCLKVLDGGLKVGYVPGVELVHLERQSFSSLGDTSFRTLVVRFNAWRHTKRWGEQIKSVMQRFG